MRYIGLPFRVDGAENNPQGVAAFVGTAQKVVRRAFLLNKESGKWKDRHGAYLCVAESRGFPLLIAPIGIVPEEKADKYLSFCQEKVRRLARHPEHVSSWQSRNPDADEWGGAVRIQTAFGELLVSMSGFPELGDEAFVLGTILLTLNVFEDVFMCEQLDAIAKWSSNEYWPRLREFLRTENR